MIMKRVIFFSLSILLFLSNIAIAQIQIGTVSGVVLDTVGAVLADAKVALENPLTGLRQIANTDSRGAFIFNNVPFAQYRLRVEASGFQASSQSFGVRSNLPVKLEIKLAIAGASDSITVTNKDGLIEKESASTQYKLDENFIGRLPGASRSRGLQSLLATTPGMATENNGLLHVRGVDDGILYVIDGIPTLDRVDSVFASSPDAEMIFSLEIITGNIPAEFGGRSGAVVTVQPKSGIDTSWWGSLSSGIGSFNTKEIAASFGGNIKHNAGLFLSSSANRSQRFLDPVDDRNFNNHGGALKFNLRSDWHPTAKDILLFNIAANGTDLRVPNRLEQEAAGQRARQELRDNSQSVSWQRIWSANTVTNIAVFHRDYESLLFGSQFDTPIFASQDRHHSRYGLIASVTDSIGGHNIKAGVEVMRVAPDEFFMFAITDAEEAEVQEVSDAALEFDLDNPFVFRDRKIGRQISAYAQDTFSPLKNFTINAGVRYDDFKLNVSDSQLSPRIGAVYYFPKTRTAIRASFNRLFMPPQIENLLLADSEQARRLSPFADESGGGALIRAEKTSAYEAGFAQDVFGFFKLDAAYWHRNFHNFDDPNVFFNTTVIFPNSVAKGFARGVDVRLDVPQRRGYSGYISLTNQRILQTGPINGGLFLTDEFKEIGEGVRFVPDHDQRNVGAFGLLYEHDRSGLWASFSGRHESGVPLEVEEERLEELKATRGADLVNFERGRVKPYTVINFAIGMELMREKPVTISLQLDAQNLANTRFAYNFGSPFEGTHFGHPRLWSGRLKFTFK
jgi:outer membrane receptor protein involved in Fe transport